MNKRRDADPHKRDMRQRFKRLVRAVMINRQWLDEPDEQAQGISMNVKKNVAFLVRQKRKTGILTVAEKALLRSPPYSRTVEERKKLCMIVAGLSCFSRIPPKLRARLVPVVKFMALGADRVLIKDNDFPVYVYFVISGEIEMKKTLFDKATKKTSMVSEAIVGPGDWIGEVELLESCPRLNTYVTMSACELLCITDADFKSILGPFMRKQWADKKSAIKSLSYFDFFTEEQVVRACSYGLLMQFDPLQFIYSDNRGAVGYVHFILSGECIILQCLKMRVLRNMGNTTYELIAVNPTDLFELDASKSRKSSLNKTESMHMLSSSEFNIDDLLASTDSDNEETLLEKKARRKVGLREIEIACGYGGLKVKKKVFRCPRKTLFKRRTTFMPKRRTTSFGKSSSVGGDSSVHYDDLFPEAVEDEYDYVAEDYFVAEEISEEMESTPPSVLSSPHNTVRSTLKSLRQSIVPSVRIETDDSVDHDTESDASSASRRSSVKANIAPETETHFVDVGSFTYGGIFGLGETIIHRVIMARTVVQCLLLPRYWLMEEDQNPGHIWKRRKFYLDGSVPSRQELFGNFLKTRRWEKFKHDYVQSTLNPNSANSTQPEDIPIICRIVETRDDI